MKSKYLYCLSLFIIVSFQVQAQSNFKPGYVVTFKNDTLKGFVDYKEWNRNPKSIRFKTSKDGTADTYNTGSIKQFSVEGMEDYQLYSGRISMGMVDLNNLSIGVDSSYVTDTVFLRTLAKGNKVSLYQYTDNIKTRFFISDAGAEPEELQRYVFFNSEGRRNQVELNTYRQQLLRIALKYYPGNVDLTEKIQRLNYNGNSIAKIVNEIDNTSSDIGAGSLESGGNSSIRFFIGIGVNATNLSFSPSSTPPLNTEISIVEHNQTYWSALPIVAGGFDIFFNKNVGKLLLRNEFSVAFNKHNAVFRQPYKLSVVALPREDRFTFNQFVVSFNPQLLYNIFNSEKVKFYLAGGAQLSFAQYSNKAYTTKWFADDNFNSELGGWKRDFITKPVLMHITAKAGLTLANKVDIFAGYTSAAQIAYDYNYSADLLSYRLGINYYLGKKY